LFDEKTSTRAVMLRSLRILRQMNRGPDGRGGRKGLMGSIAMAQAVGGWIDVEKVSVSTSDLGRGQ